MDRRGDVDGATGGQTACAGLELTSDEGFRMFYETLQADVFRLCRFQIGDAETARDLSQEAFARAFRARGGLRSAAGARAWMLRIALNVCRSHGRQRRLTAFLQSLVPWGAANREEPPDPAPGPDESAEARERERLLKEAVAGLPERERAALALVGLQGLPYADAAAALECSEEAVRQAVSRARRRLRERLAAEHGTALAQLEPAGGRP